MSVFLDVFWVFFKLGLISVGGVFGVLPELERMVVDERGWMTHERFIQSYVTGSFVPGPNMAMCTLIGYEAAGWVGWIAAFLGIYTGPILLMSLAYGIYSRYHGVTAVRRVEIALRPLVFGLLLSSSLHYFWTQSAGTEGRVVFSRLAALGLMAGGIWAYQAKRIGPMTLIFVFGAVWWGVQSFVRTG